MNRMILIALWAMVLNLSGCVLMMRGPASDREKAWEDYQAGQKQSAAEAERNSDVDGDNIPDRIDNCPLVRTFNHDQRDFDKDAPRNQTRTRPTSTRTVVVMSATPPPTAVTSSSTAGVEPHQATPGRPPPKDDRH